MRPSLFLLAIVASCASASKIACPQYLFEELVARTSCGDSKSISRCLRSDTDLELLDEVEQCYIEGGCSEADATIGAVWFAHKYRAEVEEGERIDLRRRADSEEKDTSSAAATTSAAATSTAASSAAASTAAASTSSAEKKASKTSVKSTAAQTTDSTTSHSKSTSSSQSTSSASPASSTSSSAGTTSSISSSSSTTSTSSQVTTTGTLLCSTTNTVQTSICSVSAGKTLGCVPTVTAIGTCAAGNLCMTNAAGDATCLKKDNTIGPGGIIIAIVFGSIIAGASVGLILMKYKASSAAKRTASEHQVLMSAYKGKGIAVDVEAFSDGPRGGSDVNLPLISELGAPGYGGNEFLDNGRRAPQLHQGLGALS